ncbi:hypothetical protein FVEG_02298 [Fusarium verticillioides 7600]|uniref:Uncharacterized protein n=1 Tax=Gibberella moniliformis (strain M3125 / FGSC 7600) TaxID=334819 RepID=W7LLS7_GIBM7|nr:hypothetical protein FVEG_02298 [Fusarium verticillioides 7600]EWG39491.1 hypothetical protein FVEG_02298 [Fusarium verticillioides 7600]
MCQLPIHPRIAAIGAVVVIKNYWSFLSTWSDIEILQIQSFLYVPTADSRLVQEVKTTFSKLGAQQRVRIYLCQSKNIQVYGEQTLNADYHAEKISTRLLANITHEKLLEKC